MQVRNHVWEFDFASFRYQQKSDTQEDGPLGDNDEGSLIRMSSYGNNKENLCRITFRDSASSAWKVACLQLPRQPAVTKTWRPRKRPQTTGLPESQLLCPLQEMGPKDCKLGAS